MRYRPLKAVHALLCISRWLVGTLACVKLNQGSQEAPLNHLLWFYCRHYPCYVCCSQHYSPASPCSPWTQDFASQSCVLISRVFFWWDPRSINPDLAGDEVTDCQPESCQRRTVKWAWPNECTALLQPMVGFSVCWNTEDMLFIFMCYVHYLCKIAHEALLRALKEVNFARTMTQSFSLLRNFNECIFVYCVKLLFGNGRK